MSNILCHLCGGLVDRIGLQPTGVRLCGCVAKFKARKARIALLEAENDRYRNGYKGGCWTCESVGELNVKLEAENQRLSELGGAVADQLDECRSQLAAVLLKEDKPQ